MFHLNGHTIGFGPRTQQLELHTKIAPCESTAEELSFEWSHHRQGCALAEPGGPWRLTFALGRLGNLSSLIHIICWAP